MTLLLLMGVPGAGKTTLSHQMLAAFPEAVIFSLDEKVGRFVDNFEAHKSRKDFEAVIRRHLDAVPYPQWQLVIVDDIFYLKSMRRPFERMARLCGFQLLICYVKCDLASAVERNKSRGSDQIPEETIRRIYDQLEVSENCHQFTALSDLVKEIKAAKRFEPPVKVLAGQIKEEKNTTEENEHMLRRCVKCLVEEGKDGKRLGKAKKKLWNSAKNYDFLLEEEEAKMLLKEHY